MREHTKHSCFCVYICVGSISLSSPDCFLSAQSFLSTAAFCKMSCCWQWKQLPLLLLFSASHLWFNSHSSLGVKEDVYNKAAPHQHKLRHPSTPPSPHRQPAPSVSLSWTWPGLDSTVIFTPINSLRSSDMSVFVWVCVHTGEGFTRLLAALNNLCQKKTAQPDVKSKLSSAFWE